MRGWIDGETLIAECGLGWPADRQGLLNINLNSLAGGARGILALLHD